MPARPAPAARRRSTSVPWGTSSYSISPAAASSAAGEGMRGRETNETIRRETWWFSNRGVAVPTPLATRHRRLAPCWAVAASRLLGTPELRPNPETAMDAPSGRSEIAAAGEGKTLSMRGVRAAGPPSPTPFGRTHDGRVRPRRFAGGSQAPLDRALRRTKSQETGGVLLEDQWPDLVAETGLLEIGQPAVGGDHGVVGAEQYLVLEQRVGVLDQLRREVIRRPAGQVDVHLRLVQRDRQRLVLPGGRRGGQGD